ncbi:hypothetical protein PG988_003830 [Apiospora saccharicola]
MDIGPRPSSSPWARIPRPPDPQQRDPKTPVPVVTELPAASGAHRLFVRPCTGDKECCLAIVAVLKAYRGTPVAYRETASPWRGSAAPERSYVHAARNLCPRAGANNM